MENECIMRVSILEITFANRRTRRRPGNGNKFGYYLKISYRFVSNEQNSRKLKHLRGYVFHDETADRLLIRRQAAFLRHFDGGIFVSHFPAPLKKQAFFPRIKNYF